MPLPDRDHSPGFTLVEALVSLSITSSLILVIAFAFIYLIRAQQRVVTVTYLQKTADQILLNLTQELRWAKDITALTATSIGFRNDVQCLTYTLRTDPNGIFYLEKYSAMLNTGATACSPGNFSDPTTERLNPPELEVTQFQITNRTPDLDKPSLEILLEFTSLTNNQLKFTNHTVITPRNKFPGSP